MKTKLKKLSGSRVEITVTLDSKDLNSAAERAMEKLAKGLRVEGFRKGKVPAEIAKKFIPENDLNAETIDMAVRSTAISAFQEAKQTALVAPNINVTKFVPGEMAEYTAVADVVPEVKLGDFKNLGVKKPEVKVAEKDIQGVLDNIAKSFAEKKAVRKAAELTDEVIIDFVGKRDDVAFPGGSAKDFHLVLGSMSLIPGFEDGIVGHEPGDKFNLELTFPKDYGVEDLAGAKTTFEVLLKQVNEVKTPAIDDELAKKVGAEFKTLAELRKDIEKNLSMQIEHRESEKYKDELLKALVKKSKIPAPEILIDDQMRILKDDVTHNAESRGMSFEQYLKSVGEDKESWEKKAHEIATERVQASLALQTLAVENKITVPDDLVIAKIAELKEVYKKSPEALKNLKDPNVKMDIRNRMVVEKALDFLVNSNK